jgi:hypothetical protein
MAPVVIGLFGGGGARVASRNRGDATHRPSHRPTYQSRVSRPRTSGHLPRQRSFRLNGRAGSGEPSGFEPRSTEPKVRGSNPLGRVQKRPGNQGLFASQGGGATRSCLRFLSRAAPQSPTRSRLRLSAACDGCPSATSRARRDRRSDHRTRGRARREPCTRCLSSARARLCRTRADAAATDRHDSATSRAPDASVVTERGSALINSGGRRGTHEQVAQRVTRQDASESVIADDDAARPPPPPDYPRQGGLFQAPGCAR